jgi:acetyltransferase-like isoleucine patch superfamily enzyme
VKPPYDNYPVGSRVTIRVTASDAQSGVGRIRVYFDGALKKTCLATTVCQVTVQTGVLTRGSYTIETVTNDYANNTASLTRTVVRLYPLTSTNKKTRRTGE